MPQIHDSEWDPTIGHLAGEVEPNFVGDEAAPDGKPYERRGLSPKQVIALQHLAAGRGPAAAARAADVNRGTVYRWMTYDALFREAMANIRTAGVQAARLQLHALTLHAVAAVRQGLIDGDGWLGLKLLQALRLTQDATLPPPTLCPIDVPASQPAEDAPVAIEGSAPVAPGQVAAPVNVDSLRQADAEQNVPQLVETLLSAVPDHQL